MSITWGVLAQSPEPEAHDKVFDNNPDRIGVVEHKRSAIDKHLEQKQPANQVLDLKHFCILKECQSKQDCLVYEMSFLLKK